MVLALFQTFDVKKVFLSRLYLSKKSATTR